MKEHIEDDEARLLARAWVGKRGSPADPLRVWIRAALDLHSVLLTGHFLGISYREAQALANACLAGDP